MKITNQFQRKYFRKSLQQNNDGDDFLEITSKEVQTLISLLFKIGIRADMQRRGIKQWEEYAEVLLKEYSPNS